MIECPAPESMVEQLKILAEQNLQARKADLDPLSTVRVGKLLGASLIVAGAYQKAASSVRTSAGCIEINSVRRQNTNLPLNHYEERGDVVISHNQFAHTGDCRASFDFAQRG